MSSLRYYAAKLFIYFSFFIAPFQCFSSISCCVKNFYYFLGGSHFLVILFSFLSRTLYNTWKSHYRHLQVLVMIFNKEALANISSISKPKNPTWNLLRFVSWIVVNECLQNRLWNCFLLLWFQIVGKNMKALGFHNNTHLVDLLSLDVSSRCVFRTLSIVNDF